MSRPKLLASKQQKTQKNAFWARKRDIVLGFWIGLAGAAIYINVKRKPIVLKAPQVVAEVAAESTGTTSTTATGSLAGASLTQSDALPVVTNPPTNRPRALPAPQEASAVYKSAGARRDFHEIGQKTGTDKVFGADHLPGCLADRESCSRPHMINPKCRVLQGHFYHTLYNKWLGPYSTDDAEPFQFLEIGFYTGRGYDAYKEFLPRAETHSIEIACLEAGPVEEGKWPWGNFPAKNPRYQEYLDTDQLHCGDGSNYDFLNEVWTQKMNRTDAPPLKVVIDDAAHIASHMATSLLFWFPKIEPGGILVVEDVQPIAEANQFRTDVLPQVLKDLHYCGDPGFQDKSCFPTIWPLLQSIHCEMHICVFERNNLPSVAYGKEELELPPNALNGADCLLRSTPV